MSGNEQTSFTKQVFGESLGSLRDENITHSMPIRVNSELLETSPSNTDENNAETFKGTYFAPHPPEKPKNSDEPGPRRRNKNKKRFLRRSNRVDLQSQSSEDEMHINREGLLDNRTTGSKLPPLPKGLSNELESFPETRLNTQATDHTSGPIDQNFKPVNPLKLKPLSPIKDSHKVADNFKAKQSSERGKHEVGGKGPLKPPNPIEKVSGLNQLNEQGSDSPANLDSNKLRIADNINHNDGDIIEDKSENTLTSVSSDDSSSDIDSDSPVHDKNISKAQMSPKAPTDMPPANHRHYHGSSLSLNSARDDPQQVDRHSDTEAIRRGRASNRQSSKELWGKARTVTLLPRVLASRARDRNSNFVKEELEKYLPERKLMVFVGTWNMHGEKVGCLCY
jgi:hypothetical protein